ncbi:hypothetical protein ACH46F_19030 [Streptomyces virginiae]|uniref:hypothetical protein n=1 Tax=Streptomyces virginiae TaxID=1961 RepID=UPI0037A5FF52
MVLHLLATQRGRTRDPILRIAFSRHHLELGGQARADFRTQVIDALAARLPGRTPRCERNWTSTCCSASGPCTSPSRPTG